ncbi:hypothetical protein GO491_03030 [Flavobacteriaceae bacterium Ap0902]|nr:hypothetical protein [Flavobacteriaceae bacterium Ap0902]
MRAVTLLFSLILLFWGCKTQKTHTKTDVKSITNTGAIQLNRQNEKFDFNQTQKDYNLSSFGFGYNVSLSSKDSTKPAVLTEFRDGKPYRSLEVQNGSYTENKAVKDSSISEKYKVLETQINTLETIISQQNSELKELRQLDETTKVEMDKITNNFKYLLWVLLAIALIWIGQGTGLFMVFKRLLKMV